MKKVMALLCLAAPLLINAQTGSNTYPTTGPVGIGTNSPNSQYAVHVAGSMLLQNTSSGYPSLWAKNLDGTKNLELDYGGIRIKGGNFLVDAVDNKVVIGNGNTAATEKLTIDGNAHIQGANRYLQFSDRLTLQTTNTNSNNWTRSLIGHNVKWNSGTERWNVGSGAYNDFSMVRFENGGTIGFYVRSYDGVNYDISDADMYNNYRRMFIDWYGNVGIGTNDNKGYRLAVNGSAIFTSVKVKQYPWPDYVFKTDYKLPTLPEVEQYIQQNKHLPGVPSAAEVEKEGLDVGDAQATLLKKIEELTLYIIQQHKESEKMRAQMEDLQKQINDLKKLQ